MVIHPAPVFCKFTTAFRNGVSFAGKDGSTLDRKLRMPFVEVWAMFGGCRISRMSQETIISYDDCIAVLEIPRLNNARLKAGRGLMAVVTSAQIQLE